MLSLNSSLFSRFNPVKIENELWERLHGDRPVRHFSKKSFLAEQIQTVEEMIVILSGQVKASFITPGGSEFIFEILDAPAVFGHQALFAENRVQCFPNLVALTDVEAVFVPIWEVEKLADEEPKLLKCFYNCLASGEAIAQILYFWSQRLSMLQKVAFALKLTVNSRRDENGYFHVTHEILASYIGITRANVTIALNKLHDMGLIDKKPGRIRIADMEAFNNFINSVTEEM